MTFHLNRLLKPLSCAAPGLLFLTSLYAAPTIAKNTVFATGTKVSATGPDSIAQSRDAIWVAYTNGADSTGKSGTSLVVKYDFAGNIVTQIPVPGYVDGLKYDALRDYMWVLQNQDGNSSLMLLDSNGKATTLPYAVQSGARGYDDVAFIDSGIFMSYTQPTASADPTIQYMTGVGPVGFSPVLTMGAAGTNLSTQLSGQTTTQNDPDSLKSTPFGGLMMSSGDDGQITFVHGLELATRSVSFINILDPTTGKNVSGLDDALFATTPQGSVYVADTGNNQILKVDMAGLSPMSLIASVGSLNAVVSVDMKSGIATAIIPNLKAPHGLVFVPNFNSLFGQ